MTDFVGGWDLKVSDMQPTPAFADLLGLISFGGFGKTNPLVGVTDFDSAAQEYIAGLSDGNEVSLECHYDADGATNTVLAQLQTAVDNGTNVDMQFVVNDGTNTDTYAFSVTPLSWEGGGGPEDVATLSFTVKITGAIVKT